MTRPELVIPAGNLEKLQTALLYGADAVYVGVSGLSLRASQAEFSFADLVTGVKDAHQHNVKIYAALNIFAQNNDLDLIQNTIQYLAEIKVDGFIISDPGVLRLVRKTGVDIPIHLSTQANTTNVEAVRFWRDQGVKRIVLARELNLAEVAEIATLVPEVQIELFIHGAMCMAYSGRCFLSGFRTGRSSNHGDCTHPCRWEYVLDEKIRPNQPFILEEDERYSYLLSSKDLCMIEYLPEIIKAGVVGLKVEGRMKSSYYVAGVTRTYRQALNEYQKDQDHYHCHSEWLEELGKISNRGYTTGFYFGSADEKITEINPDIKYLQTHSLVGIVQEYDTDNKQIVVGVRNRMTSEDCLELLLPETTIVLNPDRMTHLDGIKVQVAHNGYRVNIPIDQPVPVGAVIRRQI